MSEAFLGPGKAFSLARWKGCNAGKCFSGTRGIRGYIRPVYQRQSHLCSLVTAGSPLSSLDEGSWFKLICGASSHDAPSIYNLAAIYTVAGADCIDVACDRAIIRAARDGIQSALPRRESQYPPLLMVSVNAGADPHFRKAVFDPTKCPPECLRPCDAVCPADAINLAGVVADRCYGCGRCIPVCPLGLVDAVDKTYDTSFVADVLGSDDVDAVEIHTGPGQDHEFRTLWRDIGAAAVKLKIVAISLPDLGSDAVLEVGLQSMWETMAYGESSMSMGQAKMVWQADGRPMSGDIGRGTAKAAVNLAVRIRSALNRLGVPGEVQLAGGTNDATAPLMEKAGIKRSLGRAAGETAAGIGVGGYARKIVRESLSDYEGYDVELKEKAFDAAVRVATELVGSMKGPVGTLYSARRKASA